jgi:hypothetical protein
MAPSAIGMMLNNIPTVWAVPLAAVIGSITYDLSTFCTQDPPAVPTITADDVLAMLDNTNVLGKVAAVDKLRDLVGAYNWHNFCQCDTVATPAPPTPPAAPVGMPTIDLGPTAVLACETSGPFPLDVGAGQTFSFRASVFWDLKNVTLLELNLAQTIFSGSGCSIDYVLEQTDAVGAVIHTETITVGAAVATFTTTRTPVSGAKGAHINVHGNTGTGREETGPILNAWCDGNIPENPRNFGDCCSDPALLDAVQQTLAMVTLLQRQIAPFAFVDGPSHAGLSGEGFITVGDTINGVRLEVTTMPSRAGLKVGAPDFRWDVGYFSLGDADGWFGSRSIDNDTVTWQPRWAGAVTRIGYALTPGVVATVTELHREA